MTVGGQSYFSFVESFKAKLHSLKSSHSQDIPAKKGALLDAALSLRLDGSVVLFWVLQFYLNNISRVFRRRSIFGAPSFVPLLRKKWEGLTEDVKDTMQKWWHKHTRVSPNKKDVTRHLMD
jgi:hypothetical protein